MLNFWARRTAVSSLLHLKNVCDRANLGLNFEHFKHRYLQSSLYKMGYCSLTPTPSAPGLPTSRMGVEEGESARV